MQLNTAKRASSDEGSLDQYLREISQYPLITREEEVSLAQRIKQSDPEALDSAAPGARPRADRRRDRRGDGHLPGGGGQDALDLAGAPLARRAAHPRRGQQAARLSPRHPESRARRRDLRARADRVDRGSVAHPQGARGEDPAALFRTRRPGADDARGDRLAARHHARAGAADQRKGAGQTAARLASPGAGELSLLTATAWGVGSGEWYLTVRAGLWSAPESTTPHSPCPLYIPAPCLVFRHSTSPPAPSSRRSTTP